MKKNILFNISEIIVGIITLPITWFIALFFIFMVSILVIFRFTQLHYSGIRIRDWDLNFAELQLKLIKNGRKTYTNFHFKKYFEVWKINNGNKN